MQINIEDSKQLEALMSTLTEVIERSGGPSFLNDIALLRKEISPFVSEEGLKRDDKFILSINQLIFLLLCFDFVDRVLPHFDEYFTD